MRIVLTSDVMEGARITTYCESLAAGLKEA